MRAGENPLRNVDRGLFLIYILMLTAGMVNIYSSNFNPERPELYNLNQEYGKQLMWIVISIGLGGIIILLEGNFIRKYAYEIYGIVCLLLVAVLIVGTEKNGAKAWFGIGSFGIQPSEFAKIGVSLALAKFLSNPQIRFENLDTRLYTAFFIAFPGILVLLQPDAGTFIVFICFILVLYREGMSGNLLLFGLYFMVVGILTLRLKDSVMELPIFNYEIKSQIGLGIIITIIAVIVYFLLRQLISKRNRKSMVFLLLIIYFLSLGVIYGTNFAYYNVLKTHQKERIDTTLGLIDDPDGKNYNIDRAMAAIGSGKFSGKGYMKSTLANAGQKHVPMQSTDFIYCTLSEEWGFIGSFIVILLFCFLLFRIVIIAERQRSSFTRIFAYCVSAIFFFHFLINIGMAIGLAPVIGIPLPFFSYGGSSIMSFSILIFLLLKLDSERLDVLR